MMVSSEKETRLTAIDPFPSNYSDWFPFLWKTSKVQCSLAYRSQLDSIEMSFNADSFDEAFKLYEDILDQLDDPEEIELTEIKERAELAR